MECNYLKDAKPFKIYCNDLFNYSQHSLNYRSLKKYVGI